MSGLLAASSGLSPVPGSIFSNGLLVAIVVLLHVQIAAFITGSTTLAVVSESIAMARGDERHARLAHGIVRAITYVFGFGSALAIFFVTLLLTTLWALFYVTLQTVTFWIFFFEALMFIVEIALLYSLYANWARLGGHRRSRLALLVLLNIALWWQMVLINVVASFMLTPNGGDANLLDQVLNPTQLPLTVHRTIGNIAWAGAVIAAFAAVRWLWAARCERRLAHPAAAPQPLRSVGAMAASPPLGAASPSPAAGESEPSSGAYWEWLAQWGIVWAVGLTLMQPWVGYSYAKEIQLHAYGAWFTLMFGSLSNVFLVQIFLLGLIFILGTLYFQRRMRRSGARGARMMAVRAVLLIVLTLLAVQPAWFAPTYADAIARGGNRPWWNGGLLNPVGDFIPFKAAALIGMVIVGLWAVTAYLGAISRGRLKENTTTRPTQLLALALGVVVSMMMIVMGVLREHSRQPYLINGEITISGQQQLNTLPSQTGQQQTEPGSLPSSPSP
ncbi:MAG: hypothetical protein ACYDAC_12450 [Candidatus Dormibacteria bacterium]